MHLDLTESRGDAIIYAVGDLHGMYDLLDEMIANMEFDAAQSGRSALVIFLGDMVNRGPQSRLVLERLMAGPRRRGDRWICLRGNHEQSFINALENEEVVGRFLRKGGVSTALSYGLRRKDLSPAALRSRVPAAHLDFLKALPLTCRVDDLLFVHAGLEPGLPLELQSPKSLMNIREPFLSARNELAMTIVHGHVPSAGRPVVAPGRICVDTGAVMTGVLTAAVFDGARQARFIQVRAVAQRSA